MLGHAIASTFADLSTGLVYVLLGIAAWILFSLLATGAWGLAVWLFGVRPARKLREEERKRFEAVDFSEEIKVHDRTRRGPAAENHLGKQHVGERRA